MKVLDDRNVKRASAPQDAEESAIHGHVYRTKCGRQDTETLLPKDLWHFTIVRQASSSTEDNNTNFLILMFSCNMKFIQTQHVPISQYNKQN